MAMSLASDRDRHAQGTPPIGSEADCQTQPDTTEEEQALVELAGQLQETKAPWSGTSEILQEPFSAGAAAAASSKRAAQPSVQAPLPQQVGTPGPSNESETYTSPLLEVEQFEARIADVEDRLAETHSPGNRIRLNSDAEKRSYGRWMLQSSLAKADRERMMSPVRKIVDSRPLWMQEAAKLGGKSMSTAGFNDGFDYPQDYSPSRNPGTNRLEKNFYEAVEALDRLQQPWSVYTSVTVPASKPLTGWVSWIPDVVDETVPTLDEQISRDILEHAVAQSEHSDSEQPYPLAVPKAKVDDVGVVGSCLQPDPVAVPSGDLANRLDEQEPIKALSALKPEVCPRSPSCEDTEAEDMVRAHFEKLRLQYAALGNPSVMAKSSVDTAVVTVRPAG